MKEKVLSALKPLVASKGFSKEELESLAEFAAKNLTTESIEADISNAVQAVLPFADLAQKMGNRMVTTAVKKFDGWVDPTTITPPTSLTPPVPPTPPTPPTPQGLSKEEVTKLINESVATALAPYKGKEEKARLNGLLLSNAKLKDIPQNIRQQFASRYSVAKDEELDTVAEQINADYLGFKQAMIDAQIVADAPTGGGGGGNGNEDDLIDQLQKMGKSANK